MKYEAYSDIAWRDSMWREIGGQYGLHVDNDSIDSDDAFGDTEPIEPGDVVMLITGGPRMTVLSYCDECGDVEVAWFDKDDALHIQLFPEEALA